MDLKDWFPVCALLAAARKCPSLCKQCFQGNVVALICHSIPREWSRQEEDHRGGVGEHEASPM